MLQKLNKCQLELKYYKFSIKEDPNYEESWLALIEFYLNKNKLRMALTHCNKALKSTNTILNTGKCMLKLINA